ncbi:MAG TPA: LLM class oxidoreductase [Nitrospira sp.]|nr:LLM class oxidoreductase [Nitrospira sp.]
METSTHRGFQTMFVEGRLTLGIFAPIEAYEGSIPTMRDHLARIRRAERLGFAALWVRDVPLYDPSFGDVGQIYDPWVYLGYVARHTRRIALATGSIVLPLRHPLHVAKAAASIDQLSGGRLVLGVASGDRAIEFPAFGLPPESRGDRFRDSFNLLRRVWEESFPEIESPFGLLRQVDLLPKPTTGTLPLFVTGSSRQSMEWIAVHSDGWVTYPRPLAIQSDVIRMWKHLLEQHAPGQFKPFVQSLYIDLVEDPHAAPRPIHLGFRLGRNALLELLKNLEANGANHVIFNLKYGGRPADEVLEELGSEVLPSFPMQENAAATVASFGRSARSCV